MMDPRCHVDFPVTKPESERIRRVYDERAATYDRSLGIVERVMLGPFRRAFGEELQGETLEVAVGSGLNLPSYTLKVTRAAGVDISTEMLERARERAMSLGLSIDLTRADAEALPFPDQSFDTVAISLALCTIPDPTAALKEMARVCRRDGRIVLLEHVRSTAAPLATLQRLLSPLNERAVGCHLDRATFQLVRSLRFEIVQARSRLWESVQLVVARPPEVPHANLAPGDSRMEARRNVDR